MKNHLSWIGLMLSVALAACGPAATETISPIESPLPPLGETPLSMTPGAETPLSMTPGAETPLATEEGLVPPTGLRAVAGLASTILDYQVQLRDGTSTSAAIDLALDFESGTIAYLLLQPQGAESEDEGLTAGVPVPWERVTIDHEAQIITLDVSKGELEGAPTVDLATWPDPADAEWDADVRSYWEGATS